MRRATTRYLAWALGGPGRHQQTVVHQWGRVRIPKSCNVMRNTPSRSFGSTAIDVLRMKGLRASHYLIESTATVADAVSHLVEGRIGSLIVVENERIVGMMVRFFSLQKSER